MKLKNKLLLGGLTAVLLAVMSFSAWKIWAIRSEYHAGEAAYEDISHMISLPQKTAEPQPPVINKPAGAETVPFPVSWTVKMKKKQKETQDILSYHTQAAGCSDKARAKASGGRQPIEECGRTGL